MDERADIRLEAGISELETRSLELATELGLAEDEARRRVADCTAAKSEWSRALGQATAAESRAERRVAAVRHELERLRSEESQQETSFRFDRERLRQRLRNLRMQIRQAERQRSAVEHEEAFRAEFAEEVGAPARPACASGAPARPAGGGAARGSTASPGRGRGASPRRERPACGARLRELQQGRRAAGERLAQLAQRHGELLCGRQELEERERGLRRAAHLSDRELLHVRRLEHFQRQEAALREERAEAREELRALESEAERERRGAARLRGEQERALAELGECDVRFRSRRASELEALRDIDRYLGSDATASNHKRQEHLAEWVEADISACQVEHMKQRLSEIVADAGAHAQVLEQAVAELHADLDRRAAVVLELVERQSALLGAGLADASLNSAEEEDGLLSTACGCSSEESVNLEENLKPAAEPLTTPTKQQPLRPAQPDAAKGQPCGVSHSKGPACHDGDERVLELRALEAELQHQRDLFQLRSSQVQGLEQRLALLLAQEAPRVHAIRTWIAVHEPLTRHRLDACLAPAASETTLRADVEAMRQDKSAHLSEAESQWRAERQQFWEAGSEAGCAADEAAARASALQRRREGLLQGLDRLLRAERRLTSRAGGARELVERDRRQLVDATARRLRASSAAAPGRWGAGAGAGRTPARGEAAREALMGAQEIVEAARLQQVETLGSIQEEAMAVSVELKRVSEAVEQASALEEHVNNELMAAESEAESAWAHQDESHSASATCRRPLTPLDIAQPRARGQLLVGPADCWREARAAAECAVGRSTTPPAQRPTPCLRLEQRRSLREQELERAAEQLQELERARGREEAEQRTGARAAEARLEECAEALEAERARQREASGAVLRRFRSSQASAGGAEQRCSELRARKEALDGELAETRRAVRATRGQRERRARSAAGRLEAPVGSALAPVAPMAEMRSSAGSAAPSDVERQPALVRSSSEASSGSAATAATTALAPRSLPSVAEVRQRSSGCPALYAFYLQVFPLLRGASVEVLRRPLQRFELRQLVLSSDLQRLEVWPTHAASSGGSTAARGRRRVAESFVRIDGLSRVHIPKATLAAVQQAIMGTADTSEAPRTLGSPLQEPRELAPSTGPVSFPFDLMLNGAEPWRLHATDIHTFHVVTAAVGALLAARASLPSFALALGLGAASGATPTL